VSLLSRSSRRYLLRHPWQAVLSILGIAIGVAVVISIDLANQSARKAFEISMERVAGRATHHVVGGPSGIPESCYGLLRMDLGIRACAPVVEGYVKLRGDTRRPFTLLGVDPFAEEPFRAFVTGRESLDDFLTRPGAVFMLDETAESLGLSSGAPLSLETSGIARAAHLAGYLVPEDESSRAGCENLLVADIATAQELLGRFGRLSRIDLIIPDNPTGAARLAQIETHLPSGLTVIRSESRSRVAEQMMRAFDLNLTAMSLLALIVGMFLIYNTMTFSVMRRQVHLGLLRSLGATRCDVFLLVLGEALWLGAIGTAAGLGLGILMGQGLVGLVSRTINDLYFVVSVADLDLSPLALGKGAVMGLSASVLASILPARQATRSPPVSVLKRSMQETDFRARIPFLTIAGLCALVAGVLILILPTRSIVLGYAGILPLILGFAWLTPLVLLFIARIFTRPMRTLFGLIGSMAARTLNTQLSRISVAVAALGLAVAATVGVATTVTSFRSTVVHWLERRLEADVYISAPGLVSRRNDADLPAGLAGAIPALPGFKGMSYYRERQIQSEERTLILIGARIGPDSRRGFAFKEGDPAEVWAALDRGGAVMISEPFAFRNEVAVGDTLKLPTDEGPRSFEVMGIYHDYGSDIGTVTMIHDEYVRWWKDDRLSGIAVFLEEGANIEAFMDRVRALSEADLNVRTNRTLRETSIEIFDRTFVIANVLQLLAVAVAFIGVLSALMAIQLERRRELAILRAGGFTPRQMGSLVVLQSTVTGLCAGVLALPLGSVLAWALIYIINRRSFGWTLRFELDSTIFLQALVLALAAAVAAGIYPAIKLSRAPLATALREE
jgi:putative ABC transport system permease protein